MRMKASLKNINSKLYSFVLNVILTFLLRKIMIKNLGYEYIGLNIFLTSLIGFLSLGELGVSQAITYSLYEPLSKKMNKKITEIIVLYKKIYQIIGSGIFLLSIILLFFINKLIKNNNIKYTYIYFILFIFMTVTSYFLCYREILINADQKGYKLTKINTIFNIFSKIFQIIILIYTKSYFYWLLVNCWITIFGYIYNNYYIKKKYPLIDINKYSNIKIKKLVKTSPEIIKNLYTTFVYKVSLFVTYKTDDILISYLLGIKILGKYSNYLMLTSLIANFIASLFWSLNSIIGNYIVENIKENAYQKWKELTWIGFYVATVTTFIVLISVDEILILWIGKETLLGGNFIYILMINFYFRIIREPLELFRNGFGIFEGTKKIVILEAVLNLLISYILGAKYGIIGILLGTLLSYLVGCFWFVPYITFKVGFNKSQSYYYKVFFKNIVLSILSILISIKISNYIFINNFFIISIIRIVIINVVYIGLNFEDKNMHIFLKKGLNLIKERNL